MRNKTKLDKSFLSMVATLAIPMILQQLVETFVGLADSMMVSRYPLPRIAFAPPAYNKTVCEKQTVFREPVPVPAPFSLP